MIFQTVGQVDFNSLFENGELLYAPVTELLFISFVVLMPLLFITMLVGSVALFFSHGCMAFSIGWFSCWNY